MKYASLKAVPALVLKDWFLEKDMSGKDIQNKLRVEHGLIISRSAVMGRLNRLGFNKADHAADQLKATPAASKSYVEQSSEPKPSVKEIQPSDLGLDSFGEFIHVKEAANAALAAEEIPVTNDIEAIKETTPKSTVDEDTETEEQHIQRVRERLRRKVNAENPILAEHVASTVVVSTKPVKPELPVSKLPLPQKRDVPIERVETKARAPRQRVTPPDPYALFRDKAPILRDQSRAPTRHEIITPKAVAVLEPVKKEPKAVVVARNAAAEWAEIDELIFGVPPVREDGYKFLEHLKVNDCRWTVLREDEKTLFCGRPCPTGSTIKFCDMHASGAFQGSMSRSKAQEAFDKNRALLTAAMRKR